MDSLSYSDFLNTLECRAKDKAIKSKRWSNYPNSIFFYYADDIEMQDEIAIYTEVQTWEFYI